MEQKNYDEAKKALTYYESISAATEPLHRQYIYKMQAVISTGAEGDHQKAKKLLERALEETVPGFSLNDLDNHLLGEGEIVLLLMWLREKAEVEAINVQMEGKRILQYIEQVCQDEEVAANIYSKATWVLGLVEMKGQRWEEALWYTLQGEDVLANNGLLLHLPQFLERILCLTESCNFALYVEWKKQRDALKQLYEEYDEVWETDDIELWKNYRQQEVYLLSELFGQERKLVNQSQEKIADAIEIDQKTISRIESGKYKPKAGTFQKMKEYLQIDRDICSTRIVVEDFSLLDMERKIAKLNCYRREEEAEKLYNLLKTRLSTKWEENVQYMKYMTVLFDTELGRTTIEAAIEECIEAFRVTRKNLSLERIDEVVLSRIETSIVNYIARCYDRIGRKEDAIRLLEKIIQGYENSKVDLKYHYVGIALVYQHLALNCEECDRLEAGIEWCDKSIQFDLECKRGLNVGFMLSQKIYTMNRMSGIDVSRKKCYQQAYQLMKLMKDEKQMKELRIAYDEWYKEEIDV